MKKPQPLRQGDTVAITATSGPVNPKKLQDGIKALQYMGLQVHVTESCHATHEYLAGNDKLRLRDLHSVFADTSIRAIFIARGGYGAARLLPHLNYPLIAANPKILAGYSDVTALHNAINQRADLITYHAPMPAADLPNADDITLQSFKKNLFNNQPLKIQHLSNSSSQKNSRSRGEPPTETWRLHPQSLNSLVEGKATGILTGGNLTVIASLIGTEFEIDTRGKILFLEETGEAPYRVDRLLLQLKYAGKLRDATAFVLGDFSPETVETIRLAISELLVPEGKPIVAGFPAGHCIPNITLPLGEVVSVSTESEHQLQICNRSEIAEERTLPCSPF